VAFIYGGALICKWWKAGPYINGGAYIKAGPSLKVGPYTRGGALYKCGEATTKTWISPHANASREKTHREAEILT